MIPLGGIKRIKLLKAWISIYVSMTAYHLLLGLRKYLPQIKSCWGKIESLAGKTFALTDHTTLRTPRALLRAGMVLLTLFFLWATFFNINQIVHTQGEVIASSYTQIVQSADGGILAEMRVREGDKVKLGEIIATLEKDRALASYSEVRDKVMATRMTIIRLRAEVAEKPLVYEENIKKNYPDLYQTQLSLYKQRIKTIDDQLRSLKSNINFVQQELDMGLPLEKLGDVSKVDILKLRKALNEALGMYNTAKNKFLQDASAELNKAQEEFEIQQQTLLDREQIVKHTDIVAPATGIVKSVKITTLGGVIRQGDEIMQILPTESDLVIEAKVRPSDMANLRVGLPAKIKLDAYDSSIFGSMNGIITYVSADALKEESRTGATNYYRVKLSINEQEVKRSNRAGDIEVRPGMTATIDIQTGQRSVLSYLFKPLTKTFTGALGER